MKKLLTKLTPVAATVLLCLGAATTAQAAEDDKLSISGFIDMSMGYTDVDGGESDSFAALDQVEINVSYDFGNKLKAFVDVEYQDSDKGAVDVEQAYITYDLTSEFSVKAGRFLSYSGWETEEPTGLFQYSGAGYAPYFYGYYQQGVSALYNGDGYSLAVSVVNDLAGPTVTDSGQLGVETMVALMPTDNVTIKGFYSVEGDTELVNLWASYAMDALTLAAEYNMSEDAPAYVGGTLEAGPGSEASGFLLMANYAFDTWALTLRYNDWEVEDASGAVVEDASGITISPSYAVNDNLLMVFEYRMDEINDVDVNSIAVEALITF